MCNWLERARAGRTTRSCYEAHAPYVLLPHRWPAGQARPAYGVRCPGIVAFVVADSLLRHFLPLILSAAGMSDEAAAFARSAPPHTLDGLVQLSEGAGDLYRRLRATPARGNSQRAYRRSIAAARLARHAVAALQTLRIDDIHMALSTALALVRIAYASNPDEALTRSIELIGRVAWIAREATREST